jgi:hypothetical protein
MLPKEEEEEEKGEGEKPDAGKKPVAFQLFDEKWMELYSYNLSHDLIFVVNDYLFTQMKLLLKENIGNDDEVYKCMALKPLG